VANESILLLAEWLCDDTKAAIFQLKDGSLEENECLSITNSRTGCRMSIGPMVVSRIIGGKKFLLLKVAQAIKIDYNVGVGEAVIRNLRILR
jgi:hypothetical protein